MLLASARFGKNLVAHQQPELDPHSGEPDPAPTLLARGGEIVVGGELSALHSLAVVHHGERGVLRASRQCDRTRTRVEGVGYDLGQDRFLDGPGVCIPQVLEEMKKVDARFAHSSLRKR